MTPRRSKRPSTPSSNAGCAPPISPAVSATHRRCRTCRRRSRSAPKRSQRRCLPSSVADRELGLRYGLAALVAVAVAARVALLVHGGGEAGDSAAFPAVLGVWQDDPLHLYGILNPGGDAQI